jgi:hypothetical protein
MIILTFVIKNVFFHLLLYYVLLAHKTSMGKVNKRLLSLYQKSTLENPALEDGRDEEVSGRNVLDEGITLQEFEKMIKHEDRTRGRLLFTQGFLILSEFSRRPHAVVASSVLYQLQQLLPACIVCGSPRCTSIAGEWSKEPDGCVIPLTKPNPGPASPLRADEKGNAWPNVIVEVCIIVMMMIIFTYIRLLSLILS